MHIKIILFHCFITPDQVETPSIEVIPKGPRYEVGASLTIYCTADGNPSPLIDNHINYYLWIFRARGTVKDIVLTSNNGLLALQNLQVENSGKYTCTAHNSYNGKEFSSSNHIEVIIQIGKHFLYHIVSFIKNVILESLSSNCLVQYHSNIQYLAQLNYLFILTIV